MQHFLAILTGLKAAIAASAARDRGIAPLLVLVWGRVARIGTRLERLMAQWRAGTLPPPRKAYVRQPATTPRKKSAFPTGAAWLAVRVPASVASGSQMAHLLTDPEFAAFVAAVPQAQRILRPLFRMLGVIPVPEVVRKMARLVYPAPTATARLDGVVVGPAVIFSGL